MIKIIGDRKIKVHWDFGIRNYYLVIKKINGQEDVTPLTIENYKCDLYGPGDDFREPLDITFNRIGELFFWFKARDNNNELVYHFDTAMYVINEGEDGETLYRYLGYIQASQEPNFYNYVIYGGNVSTNGLYGYNNIGGGLYKYFRFAVEGLNHTYMSLPRTIKLYLINDFEYSFDYIPNEEISEIIIEKQYFDGRYESETLFSRNSIILYENQSEDIVLNKRIIRENTMYGEFRDSVSIINPEFSIETTEDITQYNYCYIPKFRRYYYIEDIICERNNIYTIICKVDVLMSFKERILQLNCKVERQEFNFNSMLIDSELPLQNDNIIEKSVDFGFPTMNQFSNNIYNFVFNIVGNENIYGRNITHFPYPYTNGNRIYISNYAGYRETQDYISNQTWFKDIDLLFQNPSDYISSIKYYYFDILDIFIKEFGVLTNPTGVYHNRAIQSTTHIYLAKNNVSFNYGDFELPYNYIGDNNKILFFQPNLNAGNYGLDERLSNGYGSCSIEFNIDIIGKYNSFLDIEPFTKAYVLLPFYGFLNIELRNIIGKTLTIKYIISLSSEIARIEISCEDVILYTLNCQVASEISLGSVNNAEKARNVLMWGVKNAGSLISSGLNISNSLMSASTKVATTKKGNFSKKNTRALRFTGRENVINETVSKIPNSVSSNTLDLISALQERVERGTIYNGLQNCNFNIGNIIYSRPVPIEVDDYAHLVGKPSSYKGKLDNLSGFTVVGACHMEGFNNATSNEIDEIERIIKTGVILP